MGFFHQVRFADLANDGNDWRKLAVDCLTAT